MRKLKLVVRTASGTLPLLVASTVISAEACGQAEHDQSDSNGAAGVGGNDATGGVTSNGGGIVLNTGGGGVVITIPTGGQSGLSNDCSGGMCRELYVELPDEGVPAEPGQICAASMMPVTSGRAALVSFDKLEATAFTGRLTLAPELTGLGVGTPTFQVLDSTTPTLGSLVFSEIQGTPEGYSFTARIDNELYLESDTQRVSILAAFEVQCDGRTQLVHSVTDVYFCQNLREIDWASSGESCCVCRVIAEMAPSPIVPGDVDDELPLARALKLRIVELARVSDVVVLLAEHDGGAELEYEWQATTGDVERLTPDVVVWRLREGLPDPLIQAAVLGPACAAVASFAFNDRIAS